MARRVHVIFKGIVQGVGFRYTTQRLAGDYQVTGYVRNLPTGGVQLCAEGPDQELKGFLQKIQGRMSGHIRETHVNWAEATGEFDRFEIRF